MKRLLLLAAVIHVVIFSYAQTATITNIKSGDLCFPIVHLKDSIAAKKINDLLQATILNQTSLRKKGTSIFDNVRWTEAKGIGLDAIGYSINSNNSKILSITINTEYQSASLNEHNNYFCFNIQNGEPIEISDLFTPQGLVYIGKKLRGKRRVILKEYPDELMSDSEVTSEDSADVMENLWECNEKSDSNVFILLKNGIRFYKDECLSHATQALSPDSMDITYSSKTLWPYLSEFGKKIFTDSIKDITNDYFPSIYKPLVGKINNQYDIVLQLSLRGFDNEIDGYYYYTSKGKAISLEGTIIKGSIILKEEDGSEQFKGTIKGNTIEGTWSITGSKTIYPFKVSYLIQ